MKERYRTNTHRDFAWFPYWLGNVLLLALIWLCKILAQISLKIILKLLRIWVLNPGTKRHHEMAESWTEPREKHVKSKIKMVESSTVVGSRRQSSSIGSVKRRGRSGSYTGMSRLGLAFLAGFAGAGQVRQRQVWDGLEGLEGLEGPEGLEGLIMFSSEKCHERRELCLASSMLSIVCLVLFSQVTVVATSCSLQDLAENWRTGQDHDGTGASVWHSICILKLVTSGLTYLIWYQNTQESHSWCNNDDDEDGDGDGNCDGDGDDDEDDDDDSDSDEDDGLFFFKIMMMNDDYSFHIHPYTYIQLCVHIHMMIFWSLRDNNFVA